MVYSVCGLLVHHTILHIHVELQSEVVFVFALTALAEP